LIVVSDASPVLNLSRIGRLDLLPSLYGAVSIPLAVHRELVKYRDELPLGLDFAGLPWLSVVAAVDQARVSELRARLDRARLRRSCLRGKFGRNFC
jgi:predicted nucleic acid-binding protein